MVSTALLGCSFVAGQGPRSMSVFLGSWFFPEIFAEIYFQKYISGNSRSNPMVWRRREFLQSFRLLRFLAARCSSMFHFFLFLLIEKSIFQSKNRFSIQKQILKKLIFYIKCNLFINRHLLRVMTF